MAEEEQSMEGKQKAASGEPIFFLYSVQYHPNGGGMPPIIHTQNYAEPLSELTELSYTIKPY